MPYHDKTSLGQNFIKYPSLVREIVAEANLNKDDLILEIGSGKGIITKELRKTVRQVIAIEKDKELAEITGAIWADFLEYELPKEKYKVFSNIPFSITSEIINKLLTANQMPEEMYLILQQEAAEKFAGLPKESQSSILTKPFYEVEILGDIDRTNFTLKPQVKIVLTKFTKREKSFILLEDRDEFRKFVIYNFNYFLKSFTFPQKKKIEQMYNLSGKKPTEVSFDTWLILYKTFKRLKVTEHQ